MRTARKAVVLGASLVGMEMAEILVKKGIDVILLDVVDQVLPRGTHPSVAAMLRRYLEVHGVDVRLGCTMEGMEGANEGVVCHFSGDVIEEADMVLVCTGVRPNLGFVDREQVKVELAVLTDERMRTSAENLYAAGDASQGLNLVSGRQDWLGTWGSACYQGRTAGRHMAGKEAVYPGTLPENISPFFEWNYAQMGDIQPQGERRASCRLRRSRARAAIACSPFRTVRLTGANLINCTHHAGKLRRAILQKWRCERVADQGNECVTESGAERILNECAESIGCSPNLF